MDLVRRQNDRQVSRFRTAFDDLFDRFLGDWGAPVAREGWAPALDVSENADALVVRAEVPGVKPDDVNVTVEGNTLVLSGQKKETTEDGGENYRYVERRYGSFTRTVPLPSNIDAGKIEASCREGVLEVKLPKSEEAKPKRIDVQG